MARRWTWASWAVAWLVLLLCSVGSQAAGGKGPPEEFSWFLQNIIAYGPSVLQFFGDQKGAFARCFSTMAASPPAASEAEKDAAAARIQKAFVGTKTAPAYGDLEA